MKEIMTALRWRPSPLRFGKWKFMVMFKIWERPEIGGIVLPAAVGWVFLPGELSLTIKIFIFSFSFGVSRELKGHGCPVSGG